MRVAALRLLRLVFLIGLVACDSNTDSEVERSYTKSIIRDAENAFETFLIAYAEALYPSRDSVLAAAIDDVVIPETAYWFYASFDGVRIPYAVTGDAVTYYSELIDALEADGQAFLLRAALDYQAEVSFQESYVFEAVDLYTQEPLPSESFERVYVVDLRLEWSQYCGSLCAMAFHHQRVVVFDEAGAVQRVFFDGRIPVGVS